MIYQLTQLANGYIFTSNYDKYLMLTSKRANSPTPYYLKKIQPEIEYISGLFYDKNKKEYKGKDMNNNKIIVRLGINTVELLTITKY